MRRRYNGIACVLAVLALSACPTSTEPPEQEGWTVIAEDLPGALLSVYAPSADNVWAVGSDPGDGQGPMVMRYDGKELRRLTVEATSDIWWVAPGSGDTLWMSGSNGLILRCNQTDETCKNKSVGGTRTFFGVFAFADDDVWAVGGDITGVGNLHDAFHFDGATWTEVTDWPETMNEKTTFFKVWGRSPSDLYIIGTKGVMLHYNGSAWTHLDLGTEENLVTVHGNSERSVLVGGFGSGLLMTNEGDGFQSVDVGDVPQINGIFVDEERPAIAVGARGFVTREMANGWVEDAEAPETFYDYHAVARDASGGVWAVGGNILLPPLKAGMIMHYNPGN
jgi:photosystem II stability/assembly factor-like uncharacterized protein